MAKYVCYIDMMERAGAQRVMSSIVTHLCAAGEQVVLVNDFIRDDRLPHYEVPEPVKRVYLREKRAGIPGIKHIQRIAALRKILKREKPDLLLSFLGRPNIIALIACLGLKTRLVVSVRNDPNKEYGSDVLRKTAVKLLFHRANGCVFQTEDAAAYFPEAVRRKSAIIFNPVSEVFFRTAHRGDGEHIVAFGRLAPQKNHRLLIDAYAMLPAEYRKDKLIIYGDGPLKDELTMYCAEKGLADSVLLPGNVPDVADRLARAKLFVLSSDYEGLPNALMEAMSVGVACIAADCPCGGPKTLIEHNVNGLLVPCKDARALCESMKRLLDSRDLRNALGSRAKRTAEAFRSEAVFKEWDAYLDTVIQQQ